jgi:N6-adenosine-specific RNA methylase IME4
MPRYSRTPAGVLVADPAWSFEDRLDRTGRGAENHYDVMTLEQIADMALPPMLDDSVLALWRVAGGNETGSLGEAAYRIARAWGFIPRAEGVWRKLTANGLPPDADPELCDAEAFGMGHYVRNMHEVFLICTRGNPSVLDRSVRSVFSAPIGRHSEKPERFYDIIERMFAGPYVEIFARRRRRGWLSYGAEIDGADFRARP